MCHTKHHLVVSCGFAVGALVAALVVVLPAVRAAEEREGKAAPKSEQPYPPYVEAWEKAKPLIDTQAVRAMVGRLRSESLEERSQALSALDAIAGYHFEYKIQGMPAEREKAVARWERYAKDMETAVNEWAPSLIATPSQRNCGGRALAAHYIGLRAPHPAFLPLLREIVNNAGDNHNDRYVRVRAIVAISRIRHEGVMEYLIDHLDTDLALWSWEQLQKLTHPQGGSKEELAAAARAFTELNKHETGEDWLVLKKRYQQWWAKNKASFTYDRGRVLGGG